MRRVMTMTPAGSGRSLVCESNLLLYYNSRDQARGTRSLEVRRRTAKSLRSFFLAGAVHEGSHSSTQKHSLTPSVCVRRPSISSGLTTGGSVRHLGRIMEQSQPAPGGGGGGKSNNSRNNNRKSKNKRSRRRNDRPRPPKGGRCGSECRRDREISRARRS